MLKFRASILALDPHAKFNVDRNPLKVTHSKCGGQSTQKAMNDTSNFKEHISICQGLHTSNHNNSPLGRSLQRGQDPSIHPTIATPIRSDQQLPCPGFSLEQLFGKDYKSLLSHEREQVARAAEVAGLRLFDSKGKGSVISMSCLKKSPSHQGPAQPCRDCSRVLERSNFKDTLRRENPRANNQRFSPWKRLDTKTTGADMNVSQPLSHRIRLSLMTNL